MTEYLCGKCHSVLSSGKVCTVCWFDNQPFIDCFVCKNQLTEGKCMTPTCPKDKDNHTDDAIRYTQPAVIDHEMLRKWYAEPTKDQYTLSREELLEKTTAIKNYDPVAKPSHYNQGEGIECIEYIKQVLGPDGFIAYCRGNMMKYNHRAMYKGNPTEDLAKAAQYLTWVNETLRDKHK
jgi:hypothetical protein